MVVDFLHKSFPVVGGNLISDSLVNDGKQEQGDNTANTESEYGSGVSYLLIFTFFYRWNAVASIVKVVFKLAVIVIVVVAFKISRFTPFCAFLYDFLQGEVITSA